MFDGLFQETTIPLLQEVVNFSQSRHNVLAGNIANLDTPGYKARDLSQEDFQQRLQQAIETRHQPPNPVSPGELFSRKQSTPGPTIAGISDDPRTITFHDGSNVGLEYQVTEMVKNQAQHNMALTIMTNQFRMLQTAISGRV